MNSRERMVSALSLREPDLVPVAPCYIDLYLERGFWRCYLDAYIRRMAGSREYWVSYGDETAIRLEAWERSYRVFEDCGDWMWVNPGPPREWAEGARVLERGGEHYLLDGLGAETHLEALTAIQTRRYPDAWDKGLRLRSKADVDRAAPAVSSRDLELSGCLDLPRMAAERRGAETFICATVGAPFWSTFSLLGFRGMIMTMVSLPEVFTYLVERMLERTTAWLRCFSRAGVHGVWIEECLASADVISPRQYERFAFPFEKRLVEAARDLGLTPIFYICGDVYPRLPMMRRLGPAAFAAEESKKGFTVEIERIVEELGEEMCVFGNVDAVNVVLKGTMADIESEVVRQLAAGNRAAGFVTGIGSPFPLETDPKRIDCFIALARRHGGHRRVA